MNPMRSQSSSDEELDLDIIMLLLGYSMVPMSKFFVIFVLPVEQPHRTIASLTNIYRIFWDKLVDYVMV